MRRTFFHIGLHKTGTTFLQKRVFSGLSGIHVLGPGAGLKEIVECPLDLDMLVSDEALSGMPWGESRDRAGGWRQARRIALLNLAEYFPEARILIGVRPHGDLIESLYRQYLHEGGTEEFEGFFGDNCLIENEDLEFGPFLETLESLFRREPFVFSMNEVWANPSALVRRIGCFLGVDVVEDPPTGVTENRGVRGYRARTLRLLNIVSKSALNPTGRINLRNGLFRRLGVDPRGVCQNILPGDWGRDVGLSHDARQALEKHFASDWAVVTQRISRWQGSFDEESSNRGVENNSGGVVED